MDLPRLVLWVFIGTVVYAFVFLVLLGTMYLGLRVYIMWEDKRMEWVERQAYINREATPTPPVTQEPIVYNFSRDQLPSGIRPDELEKLDQYYLDMEGDDE